MIWISLDGRALCLLPPARLSLSSAMAQPKPADPAPEAAPQDKRIMGVLPNYRTADGTQPFHPITAKYKLTIAAKDSFDGPNYVIGGVFAGLYQLQNQHPSFGQGIAGYAHRY